MTLRAPFGMRGENLHTLMNFLIAFPMFVAMGYSMSFFGGVVSYKSVYTLFPQVNTSTTTGGTKTHKALVEGAVVSTVNFGAVAGCLSCMWIGNRLGRKKTTLIGALIAVVGTVIHCAAYSTAQLVVGRFVLGAGLGMMGSTIPPWQSEMSKTHQRGRHVIVDGICIAGGIALAGWVNYGFSHADTAKSWVWRLPCIGTGPPCVLVLLTAWMFPESPRWLVLKGRQDEAREVFAMVEDADPNDERVSLDLATVVKANNVLGESSSLRSLFVYGKDKNVYRLFLAVSVQFITQMNGAGIITYYSKLLFENIGLSDNVSGILASTSLTFKFICCFIPFFTIEMAGRKRLFIIALSGMSACMFCLAICGSKVTTTHLAPAYAGIVFAYIFVFFLPIAFLGVNFLFCQEVISTRYRAPVAGISTAMHWASAATVALVTPLGFTTLSWKFYLIWGCASASFVPFVYVFYPETTGISIEEMDIIFIEASGPLDVVRRAKLAPRHGMDTVPILENIDDETEEKKRQSV